MPEQKQNPFEAHINSEAFDVSGLDDRRPDPDWEAVRDFLDSLPQPLSTELWDDLLDDKQKVLCAYLATELVDRVMRSEHEDLVGHLSDDQLIYLLTLPVTLSMVAEERLHRIDPEYDTLPLPPEGRTASQSIASLEVPWRHWWQQSKHTFWTVVRRLDRFVAKIFTLFQRK